jgi:hypothetical protein
MHINRLKKAIQKRMEELGFGSHQFNIIDLVEDLENLDQV